MASGSSAGPVTGTSAGRIPAPAAGLPVGQRKEPSPPAVGTDTLNDRLKHLAVDGDVDYRPKRVAVGDAQSVLDSAVSGYEQGLTPPPDILRRTFGFIYELRTARHPDSIAYVYDTYTIGPITMCKAWKLVEHPYQAVREVGPVGGSAGIGGGVVTGANSPVVRHDSGGAAEIETVQFPCTERSYTAVRRGSLTAPLPRHPQRLPSPAAAGSGSPAPSASLAP
jgi:hypothetical protein